MPDLRHDRLRLFAKHLSFVSIIQNLCQNQSDVVCLCEFIIRECSNVYCCSNKYRNTFTADNINILPSFIAVWTSGSWCASQISCCQWCLCSVTRSLSLRWQSDPAGAGAGGPPHGAGGLLPVATRDVQEVDP